MFAVTLNAFAFFFPSVSESFGIWFRRLRLVREPTAMSS
jgi:hypothetical protein